MRLFASGLVHEAVHQVLVLGEEVPGVRQGVVGADQGIQFRILPERQNDAPQRSRMNTDVRIDKEKDVARRVPGAHVAGVGRTAAPSGREQGGAELPGHLRRGIGGTVVHDDAFERSAGRLPQRCETHAQVAGRVIDRDNYRDCHSHKSPFFRSLSLTLLVRNMQDSRSLAAQ